MLCCACDVVQIHGLVSFRNDIDVMVVNARHESNPAQMKQIQEFAEKYGISIVPMPHDDTLPKPGRVLPPGSIRI